ncbi:MAG: ROK family protein, partial [Bacteroidota bacterium]
QDEITAKAVIEAAKLGDKLALQIFDNAIMYLGVGIDGLIKLFNPEKIVLSGGLTLSGDFLMDKLKKSISQHSMGNLSRKVEIVYSTFGENATLMGAFSMILIKVLNLEIDNNNNTGYTS